MGNRRRIPRFAGLALRRAVTIFLFPTGIGLADAPAKPLDQYVHTVWTSEQGLPQNSVQTIAQTRDGFLWMGTEEGLVRFDGVGFAVFNKTNTPEIKHNDIRQLLEDKEGGLWGGTLGGGVWRYAHGSFRSYTVRDGLSNNFVTALAEDPAGNVWMGTREGLTVFHAGTFTRYGKADGISDNIVNDTAVDGENVWVGTSEGLDCVRPGGRGLIVLQRMLAHKSIKTLYVGRAGELWIGTDGAGLFRLSAGELRQFDARQGLPLAPILALLEDEAHTLWIGTGGGGICSLASFDKGTRAGCYTSKDGLSGDTVFALFQDREGNIWAGTEAGGVNRFKNGALTTFGPRQGIEGAVRSMYPSFDGSLWVATESGLTRWGNGVAKRYPTPYGAANNYALAVMEDRDHNVWVGTNEGGLNKFFKGGDLKRYTTSSGLPDNQIHAVFQDRAGNIWLGTEESGAVVLSNGKFKAYTTKDGLINNRVWYIFEDHAGDLWFGTDSGISRFHDGKFTNVEMQKDADRGTAVGATTYITEDSDHVIWIGTYGTGLKRLENGKLTTYKRSNGLFDDTVWEFWKMPRATSG